jgi:hypothetical protein
MSSRATSVWLWVLATGLMLAAGSYQERTGPTYPVDGTLDVAGVQKSYSLPRTQTTGKELRVALPDPGQGSSASVVWRRYPTDDPFTTTPLRPETDDEGEAELAAGLPSQPPAGKVEYRVEVQTPGGLVRIPSEDEAAAGKGMIVARYKDAVPLPLLISHIACMFFALLLGIRVALGAILQPSHIGRLPWISLGLMTVGGLVLGPFVQKYAFGAFWTGFPWGYDLTDNKTLIMWLAWAAACVVLWRSRRRRPGAAEAGSKGVPSGRVRVALVLAALVMTGVYLIPHSFKGSQLDYGSLDKGAPAPEAVRTGG